MANKKHPSAQCPGCHSPLIQDKNGSICRTCGWTVAFSDKGDWFVACYNGKVDRAELERICEMVRPYRQAMAGLATTET